MGKGLAALLALFVTACEPDSSWELLKAWPEQFTEVRAIRSIDDALWVGAGDANPPHHAEVWRLTDEWVQIGGDHLKGSWEGAAKINDLIGGDVVYAAVSRAYSYRPEVWRFRAGRWEKLGGLPIGEWQMPHRLFIRDGRIYAFLKNRNPDRQGDISPVWVYDGSWKPVPFPVESGGIYSIAPYGKGLLIGTQGNPVELVWWDFGEDWSVLGTWDARFVESICAGEQRTVATLGWNSDRPFKHPVRMLDSDGLRPLGTVPDVWREDNNFNSCAIGSGIFVSSAGVHGDTSIWQFQGGGWTRIGSAKKGSWPELPDRVEGHSQWTYRMAIHEDMLVAGFAGHEGAAQLWALDLTHE